MEIGRIILHTVASGLLRGRLYRGVMVGKQKKIDSSMHHDSGVDYSKLV